MSACVCSVCVCGGDLDAPEGAGVEVEGHDEAEEDLEDAHAPRADVQPLLHHAVYTYYTYT